MGEMSSGRFTQEEQPAYPKWYAGCVLIGGDIDLKQVYLASPLRGDYDKNIHNAVEYCRLASEAGVLPLAPHIIFRQWCNDTIPEQRERGLNQGLELLEKSEELWIMGTQVSEGMRGEIAFAKDHGIPTFFISHPFDKDYYPISRDENRLLTLADCMEHSPKEHYGNAMVILRHEHLKPKYRTAINQLWLVTHGPGCRPDYLHSDTIHLKHPVDGDRVAVGRGDVWGIPDTETLEWLKTIYPKLNQEEMTQDREHMGDMCR